jgi:hypothetical protein
MLSSSGHTSVADHRAVPGPDPKSISDRGVHWGRLSLIWWMEAHTRALCQSTATRVRRDDGVYLVHDAEGAGVDAGETMRGVGHGLFASVHDGIGHRRLGLARHQPRPLAQPLRQHARRTPQSWLPHS